METYNACKSYNIIIGLFLVFLYQVRPTHGCDGLVYNTTCIKLKINNPIIDFREYRSWDQSNEDAHNRNVQLVSIQTLDKFMEIKNYIQNTTNQKTFYIGLSREPDLDRTVVGNWRWASNDSLTLWDKWKSGGGEPNVRNTLCAGVIWQDDTFLDLECDNLSAAEIGLTYIYEYPIVPQPINFCERINCNNGSCLANGSCDCSIGYTGEFCNKTEKYLCANLNCNNGSCLANGTCQCTPGFKGQFCNITSDENYCENVNCNNGSCLTNGTCDCSFGFEGEFCNISIEINGCNNVSCNNGFCRDDGMCECSSGFTGEFCNITAIENICETINCENNGTCYELRNGSYWCDCTSGFQGELCDVQFCTADSVSVEGITYSFSDTQSGAVATSIQLCPVYSQKANLPMANRSCTNYTDGIRWGELIFNCDIENTTENLMHLSQVEVTDDNIETVANALETLTSNASSDGENVVVQSSQVLENIVSMNSSSKSVTIAVVNSVNNILEIADEVVDTEETRRASSNTIISLEHQLETVASANLDITLSRKNVAVTVARVDKKEVASNGLVYALKTSDHPSLVSSVDIHEVDTSLELPSEVVDDRSGVNISVVFTIYQQPTLFKSNHDRKELATRVISAKILHEEIQDLENPVIGIFEPTRVNGSDAECVFWDFDLEDGIGNWSSEGCNYQKIVDGRVICHCNHLTNFAVLMDFHGQHELNEDPRYKLIDIISLVGCCVSIVALLLTIIVQLNAKRKIPHSREQHLIRPKLVLINLSVSLCFLYVVFAFGIELTNAPNICILIAVLMHYFTISSMSWMTVQAVNIYLSLVKVFPTYISKFKLKAYAFGWGFPVVAIVLSLSLDTDSYYNENYCFIKPGPALYYGNISVIAVLFWINAIIFAIVLYRIVLRSRSPIQKITEPKSRVQVAKDQLSTAVGLSILLGLTWVFGFGDIHKAPNSNLKFTMQLLFCIFNTLQGVFIFLFYAVRTGDFKKCICSFCPAGACCTTPTRDCFHVSFSSDRKKSGGSTLVEQTMFMVNTDSFTWKAPGKDNRLWDSSVY
ncbi:adhesion G-protein coupled receptor G7-like isoform X2 [Antedon mediterranea]|uniref:adhesion G-protein coupled receptor G7-like isoform X2 n=1 Tax=Antedon mediterranea TaxID=105859 RepID=UPI003AF7120A